MMSLVPATQPVCFCVAKGYDGIAYSNTFETKKATTSYIVFNSNQVKEIANKTPTASADIMYSDRLSQSTLEKYSKKEYNSFGWVRVADAISFNELDDLYSKIQEKSSLSAFNQSSRGEAIIEVNNKPNSTLDVDNVFVFVEGTKNNFAITRVVRFQAETATEMEILKEHLYEGRTCSNTYLELYQKEGITSEYRRENSPTFDEYREWRGNRKTSRGTDQNYRRSSKYRSGYSLSVGENGEITESNYPQNIEYRYFERYSDEKLDKLLEELLLDLDWGNLTQFGGDIM